MRHALRHNGIITHKQGALLARTATIGYLRCSNGNAGATRQTREGPGAPPADPLIADGVKQFPGLRNEAVVQNFQTHPEPGRVRQTVCTTGQARNV